MSSSLPALTGSEKQIAWATQIRTTLLQQFDIWRAALLSEVREDLREPMATTVDAWLAGWHRETRAGEWIDARTDTFPLLHPGDPMARATSWINAGPCWLDESEWQRMPTSERTLKGQLRRFTPFR